MYMTRWNLKSYIWVRSIFLKKGINQVWRLSKQLSRRIRSHMRNDFSPWFLVLGGLDWWKNRGSKISCNCPFKKRSTMHTNVSEVVSHWLLQIIEPVFHPNPHCFIAITKATACGWKEPLNPLWGEGEGSATSKALKIC
jgi:hypothetical protein